MYEIHSITHGLALSFLSLCDWLQLSTGTWNVPALPWADCSFLGCHSEPSPSPTVPAETKLLVTLCNGQWHYCLKEHTSIFTSFIFWCYFPSSAFTPLRCIPYIWELTPEFSFATGTCHKRLNSFSLELK